MKKKTKIVFFIIIPILIIAHLFGFKIFGCATLIKNQPLDNPVKLVDITETGNVILESDAEYHIYGITTILPKPLEQVRYFKFQIPTLEIEIETPEDVASKIWMKNRLLYWCGNTWMPQPFPPRLDAFRKADLGEILIREGAAVPAVSVFNDKPEYAKQLMTVFSGAAPKLMIEQNSESVSELGEYLLEFHPEYFREGAWLLAHQGRTAIFDSVVAHLKQLTEDYNEGLKINRPPNYTTAYNRALMDLISILETLSSEKTVVFLSEYIQADLTTGARVQIACRLLSLNSTFGFDTLMAEMMAPDVDVKHRSSLNHEMQSFLSNSSPYTYFDYNNPRDMYDWYQQHRKQLYWDNEQWHMSHGKESHHGKSERKQ